MNREQFLSGVGKGRRYKCVDDIPGVPAMWLRSLTEREKSEFEERAIDRTGKRLSRKDRLVRTRAALIVLCLVDGNNGDVILTDDDIDSVMEMDGLVTGRLYDEIVKHVGYAKTDLEELAKN